MVWLTISNVQLMNTNKLINEAWFLLQKWVLVSMNMF